MEFGNLFSKIKDSYGNVYDEQKDNSDLPFVESVNQANLQKGYINQNVSNPIASKNIVLSVEMAKIIKKLSLKTSVDEKLFIDGLGKIVEYSLKQKPNLLKKYLIFLDENHNDLLPMLNKMVEISSNDFAKGIFLFDNLMQINNILLSKNITVDMQYKLLDILNQQNYDKFLISANKDKSGTSFVQDFLYSLNIHKIEYGDTCEKVDSSEILALLTGITSLSYAKTSNKQKFNDTVKKLIEESHYTDDTHYSEIVEGILIQKPQLAKIAIAYKNLNAKWSTWLDDYQDVIKKQEQFFENLDKKCILPKELVLKKIVPDKNAFKNPQYTVDLFYERMFC